MRAIERNVPFIARQKFISPQEFFRSMQNPIAYNNNITHPWLKGAIPLGVSAEEGSMSVCLSVPRPKCHHHDVASDRCPFAPLKNSPRASNLSVSREEECLIDHGSHTSSSCKRATDMIAARNDSIRVEKF